MTNQEPGAPEPLTSEEERALRAEIAALKRPDYDSFKGRVGRLLATLDRDRAALSHPESDTRGLDVERLATALDNTPTRVFWRVKDGEDRQGLVREWAANISAAYARLSASPGLSIDREAGITCERCGARVREFKDAVTGSSWRDSQGMYRCAEQAGYGKLPPLHKPAIRGTSQPEPTE